LLKDISKTIGNERRGNKMIKMSELIEKGDGKTK